MGVFKNTNPDEMASIESNTNQSGGHNMSNQQGEQQLVTGTREDARSGGSLADTSLPSDDELIPWKFVPQVVVTRLVHKLNPEMPLSGNDWKALAGAMGLNSEEIRFLGSVQGVHSEVFLNTFAAKPDASLNEMLDALKSINRRDCVDIIREALPEIRQKVQTSLNSPSMLQMAEATSMLTSHSGFMWPKGTTMIVPAVFQNGSSSIAAMGQPSAGICHISLPCNHVTAPHADNCFSQQHAQNFSTSVGSGGPVQANSCRGAVATGVMMGIGCCSPSGNGMVPSAAASGCMVGAQQVCGGQHALLQQQHQQQSFQPSRSPQQSFGELGCMRMDTSLPVNISPLHSGFISVSNNNSICNNINNAPGNSHRQWEGTCGNRHGDCAGNVPRQKVARQFSDDCKAGQQQCHHGNKHLKHSVSTPTPRQSLCQHCGSESRPGQMTPPAASIRSHPSGMWASHSSQLSSSTRPSPNSQTNLGANCGGRRETTSSPRNMFLSSPSSTSLGERDNFITPGPSSGGTSDRCQCRTTSPSVSSNSNCGTSGGQNRGTPSRTHEIPPAKGGFFPSSHDQHSYNRQNQTILQQYEGLCNTSNADSHLDKTMDGLTAASEDGASGSTHPPKESGRHDRGTSLSHLEKLAAMPDEYKPSSKYQTVVAEQKIEMERSKKIKSNKSSTKHSFSDTSKTGSSFNTLSSNTNGSSAGSASQTFPMRVKVRHERDGRGGQGGSVGGGMIGVEDLGSLTISKKSVSMPQDMKPQPYRKAWRGIKVFVTYSMDNPSHNNEVLCLGYFLKNNGFNCYLDTPFKLSKPPEAWLEHIEKLHRKFFESDFVLVCISPKYLQDVSVSEPASGECRLHTLDIYQLMNREYLNRQASGDGADGEVCDGRLGQSMGSSSTASTSGSEVPHSPQVVPVLFGNMAASQIPPWMRKVGVPCKRWEADYADLAWLLTKPQNRIRPIRQSTADLGTEGY